MPGVPPDALLAAVRRTGPRSVVLWSHTPATADAHQLERLLRHRPVPVVTAAVGPGWRAEELPPTAHNPHTLAEALHVITEAG